MPNKGFYGYFSNEYFKTAWLQAAETQTSRKQVQHERQRLAQKPKEKKEKKEKKNRQELIPEDWFVMVETEQHHQEESQGCCDLTEGQPPVVEDLHLVASLDRAPVLGCPECGQMQHPAYAT